MASYNEINGIPVHINQWLLGQVLREEWGFGPALRQVGGDCGAAGGMAGVNIRAITVATSRAKCLCVLVAAPEVFEAECRTPGQMRLANAFCRYLEVATAI